MDAEKTEGVMGTSIPIEIECLAGWVSNYLTASVYLSGGALLPHKTRDYDFLIVTQMNTHCILEAVRHFYEDLPGVREVMVSEAYGDDPDAWRLVCTLHLVYGYKVDLLVLHPLQSIQGIMGRYPLSVQKQSLWLAGPKLYDSDLVKHEAFTDIGGRMITVYQTGTSMEKYMRYYPNHAFLLLPQSWKKL